MKTHAESIELEASPCDVWRTLLDLERYPKWNRTIPHAAGEWREGGRLALRLELGSERRNFDPRVVEVKPERLLLLEKVALHRALLRATHAFRLEALDGGRCRLTQEWRLTGLLVPVVWPKFRGGFPAFAQMNSDLARELEHGEVAHA